MTRNRLRAIFGIAMLLALALGQVGCNTTKGAGKDIEKAGEGIQDTAQKASDAMD